MKSLFAMLLFFSFVVAAPAPFPKPERHLYFDDVVGVWKYKYGSKTGFLALHSDGNFQGNLETAIYIGTWKLNEISEITLMEKTVWYVDGRACYGSESKYIYKFPITTIRKPGKIKKLEGTSTYSGGNTGIDVSLER